MAKGTTLPSYVARLGSDHRRYYKPEFIAGVVADIREGRTTVAEVAEKFHIHRTAITRWLTRNQQGKRPGRPGGVPRTTPPGPTLAEKALAAASASPAPSDKVDSLIGQQIDLAALYAAGKIDRRQVKIALDKSADHKFMVQTWLGGVLVAALRSGYSLKRG